MCGIAGIWGRRGTDIVSTIGKMTQALHHRGPDSYGTHCDLPNGIALGHRRLSIVELTEAGHQPMQSHCERYWIVYNGELYNHEQLRKNLEKDAGLIAWRGQSDTETLIAAISTWGLKDTLNRVNGMFAFAVWDQVEKCIYIARDRFGEKPLYYGVVDGAFVFGSELSAIRQVPGWRGDIDEHAVGQFLRYSSISAPYSIYRDIKKLPAAHWATIHSPEKLPEPDCYWQVDNLALNTNGLNIYSADEQLLDVLQNMMRTQITSRMMSDVPLGAFLSGGIDSSLVVALMQEASMNPVQSFCVGFEESSHDESKYARSVARHLGTHHTEHIVTGTEALATIPDLSDIWDEPFADSSQIPTYLVSKLARKSVSVALSGDGGDELFGGYGRYSKTMAINAKLQRLPLTGTRLASLLIDGIFPSLADMLAKSGNAGSSVVNKLDRLVNISELMRQSDPDALYDSMLAVRSGSGSLMRSMSVKEQALIPKIHPAIDFPHRMMLRDLVHYLPEVILTKVDRASMSVGLEARAPLLDAELASFAMGLPWSVKHHDGVGKWPLLGVLKRYIPAELVDRPKMGFGVPINTWLRGPLKEWGEDLMSPTALQKSGLLNDVAIRRLWKQHHAQRNDWKHPLWNVLMLQSWLQRHQS